MTTNDIYDLMDYLKKILEQEKKINENLVKQQVLLDSLLNDTRRK